MSIKDLEKISARQMESLQRKQARETARMAEGHDNLKTEIKKENSAELVDLQQENVRQMASENEKKEKVLEQMKHHLNQTQRITDTQIRDLRDNVEKVKKTENEKLTGQRSRIKEDNDLHLEEMGYRFSEEHKKLTNQNQEQLQNLQDNKRAEIRETDAHFRNKINTQTTAFTERFKADGQNQKRIKEDQDKQFKNERMTTNVRQQQEMGKLTTTHNQTIEVRDDEFRKGIKTQDLMFEKKYAESLKLRNEDLKRLEELNSKVMTKMKTDLTESLKTTINKADDPFYRFTELRPEMKQYEDRVEISVEVPDHAKADVQLTIHNKEAIINFNRRYDDTRKEAGTTNKIHKVESFTTRLMTEHHLDPKSVKSKYENGVMTYVVKRS